MQATAWYDRTPAERAKGLRYAADESERCAKFLASIGDDRAERYVRQARRLRAMAILCDHSKATKAAHVDFLGMTEPSQTREQEDKAVAKAERLAR